MLWCYRTDALVSVWQRVKLQKKECVVKFFNFVSRHSSLTILGVSCLNTTKCLQMVALGWPWSIFCQICLCLTCYVCWNLFICYAIFSCLCYRSVQNSNQVCKLFVIWEWVWLFWIWFSSNANSPTSFILLNGYFHLLHLPARHFNLNITQMRTKFALLINIRIIWLWSILSGLCDWIEYSYRWMMLCHYIVPGCSILPVVWYCVGIIWQE